MKKKKTIPSVIYKTIIGKGISGLFIPTLYQYPNPINVIDMPKVSKRKEAHHG